MSVTEPGGHAIETMQVEERRLLRDLAENRVVGDTTTLADPTVVDEIGRRAKSEAGKEE